MGGVAKASPSQEDNSSRKDETGMNKQGLCHAKWKLPRQHRKQNRELEESLNEIIKKAVTTKVMCEPG